MKLRRKSTLIFIGTLLIGMVLGALFTSMFVRHRIDKLKRIRTKSGLTETIIKIIEPTDAKQEKTLRNFLKDKTAHIVSMNQTCRYTCRQQTRAAFDSLTIQLLPILTDEQEIRLKKRIKHHRKRRKARRRE